MGIFKIKCNVFKLMVVICNVSSVDDVPLSLPRRQIFKPEDVLRDLIRDVIISVLMQSRKCQHPLQIS